MYEAVRYNRKVKYSPAILFFAWAALFCVLPVQAQLVGTDTAPGSPCAAKGAVRMTANPNGLGAYILTCDGNSGQWIATINAAQPTADEQAANKEYVDHAAERTIPLCTNDAAGLCLLGTPRSSSDPQFIPDNIAGGVNILGVTGNIAGSCLSIGELCPDGTVYIGYHPSLHVPLYIPTVDQMQRYYWKTSSGANDIATDSADDGRANSNQLPNSPAFPAAKSCKDLTAGGHSDWYLPSLGEVYYLLSVREAVEGKGNITPFLDDYYWTSTEYNNNSVMGSNYGYGGAHNRTKTFQGSVRCFRR